ncbi:cupin domain-containing protein [Vibrio sp. 99K-1]|nr:cupin domain-containing protein [Vibrio sp. 99K-1]
METIKSIVESGIEKNLGEVKNFRANEEINRFIPEQARLAVSWVRLAKGEKLDLHVHPISSLYIICEGEAILLGNGIDRLAVPGDVICIPPGADHGFIGVGENGYWGLSIQFEERGLYEDPDMPLVNFKKDPYAYYHLIKERNNQYIERYKDNKIFQTFSKDKIFSHSKKALFLDYLQVLSDQFQKMVLLRSALCEDDSFSKFFSEHLKEEFGHDELLKNSRENFQKREDPIFEALCIWFNHQMLTLDNLEKAILVHFVIEGSAFIFYNNIKHVFDPSKYNHFDDHSEFDGDHQEVDKMFFKDMTEEQFNRTLALLDKSWNIVEQQYERFAELIEE